MLDLRACGAIARSTGRDRLRGGEGMRTFLRGPGAFVRIARGRGARARVRERAGPTRYVRTNDGARHERLDLLFDMASDTGDGWSGRRGVAPARSGRRRAVRPRRTLHARPQCPVHGRLE